jgi:predicted RNA-binding protein with PIN domain
MGGSAGGHDDVMPARMIVDGNNVLGSRPDGWWKDREGATRRLVERLGAWAAASSEDVLIVFDGRPPAGLAAPRGWSCASPSVRGRTPPTT